MISGTSASFRENDWYHAKLLDTGVVSLQVVDAASNPCSTFKKPNCTIQQENSKYKLLVMWQNACHTSTTPEETSQHLHAKPNAIVSLVDT